MGDFCLVNTSDFPLFYLYTVHLRDFHPLNLNPTIMRVLSILSAAAVASAFVIPDQATLESLAIEEQGVEKPQEHPFWSKVHKAETFWEDLEEEFTKATHCAKHKFEEAVESTQETAVKYGEQFHNAFAGDAWLESAEHDLDLLEHPPHHGPPNQTVYQLISKSKYTTKLAAAIDEFPDLVDLLNGTKANYTLFAPTDHAFEKIPKHAPKPPKEFLKKLLTYHVSEEFYPAGRIHWQGPATNFESDLIERAHPQFLCSRRGD